MDAAAEAAVGAGDDVFWADDFSERNAAIGYQFGGGKGDANPLDGFTNPILRLVLELAKDVWLDDAGPQPSRIRRATRLCLL